MKTAIKKNDKVMVIAGKDKGKTGKVLTVIKSINKAKVEGINIVKKHSKPTYKSSGGIVDIEAPIHLSNLMLICAKCTEATKVGYKLLQDGEKVRICKKCGEIIPVEA